MPCRMAGVASCWLGRCSSSAHSRWYRWNTSVPCRHQPSHSCHTVQGHKKKLERNKELLKRRGLTCSAPPAVGGALPML